MIFFWIWSLIVTSGRLHWIPINPCCICEIWTGWATSANPVGTPSLPATLGLDTDQVPCKKKSHVKKVTCKYLFQVQASWDWLCTNTVVKPRGRWVEVKTPWTASKPGEGGPSHLNREHQATWQLNIMWRWTTPPNRSWWTGTCQTCKRIIDSGLGFPSRVLPTDILVSSRTEASG